MAKSAPVCQIGTCWGGVEGQGVRSLCYIASVQVSVHDSGKNKTKHSAIPDE